MEKLEKPNGRGFFGAGWKSIMQNWGSCPVCTRTECCISIPADFRKFTLAIPSAFYSQRQGVLNEDTIQLRQDHGFKPSNHSKPLQPDYIMAQSNKLRLFFVINPGSGNNSIDWSTVITDYFTPLGHTIELYQLPKNCALQTIKDKINSFSPQQVVAVGGDGTIKLVADCLLQKDIALGILPAGSANGLAKELGISNDPEKAMEVLVNGHPQKIHATNINDHLCIHLSDIGLNAYAMKKFEHQRVRGMWGYFMASLKVLWQNPLLEIKMQIDKETIKIKAEMIVIANATKYGSGAVINPVGTLDDDLFEVIAIKKISILEILKMVFAHASYDSDKTEVFQTNALSMRSAKRVHFQVDGEYLGKVRDIKAVLIPDALTVMVPTVE